LISRVANYSAVSSLFETSKGYYNWGKENSKVVAFAEASFEGGLQWLTPKFETVLDSATYKNYAQPLLSKADGLSLAALDTVENKAQKFKTDYDTTKEALEERVTKVKNATYSALEVAQKYVAPVDEYLKESVVARPFTFALGVTEKVADRLLPAEDEGEDEERSLSGPISRTTHLSQRAFSQLQNLTFRAPEHPMQYTVDLIKYAAHTLDEGVAAAVVNGTNLVREGPKEVRAKVTGATQSAVTALRSAVDSLSAQLPTKIKQLKESAAEGKADSVALFSNVAQSGSRILHEVSSSLQTYAAKGETVPGHLLASAAGSLHKVLSSLLSLAPRVETKDQPDAPADISGSN